MQSSFQRQEPSATAPLVSWSLDHKLSSQAGKDWKFLHSQAPNHQELDRWALAPPSPPSNVKNAAGGAGTAAGIEAEGSHSAVDTLSTTLHPEGWILQGEGQNIPSPAVWEGGRGESGTECLLKAPGRLCLPSLHIFMAGSFLLPAPKHKYSQLYLPETPPLPSRLLLRLPRKSEVKLFNFRVGFLLD